MREYTITVYKSQPAEDAEVKPILILTTDERRLARAMLELGITNDLFVETTKTATPKAVKFAGL